MNYAKINPNDIANGEGVRVSLFVSGCRHHCQGCFNKEAWDFSYGKPFNNSTIDEILSFCNKDWIAGLTLLGGEPLEPENQKDVCNLIIAFREKFPDKTIWLYTGFVYEVLASGYSRAETPYLNMILDNVDVLVDGPFAQGLKNIRLKFRGSENQRIIDLKATREKGEVTLYM